MLSHEKDYCPINDVRTRLQSLDRPDVFSRMQVPNRQHSRSYKNHGVQANAYHSHQPSLKHWESSQSRRTDFKALSYNTRLDSRDKNFDSRDSLSHTWDDSRWKGRTRQSGHANRIIRRRDDGSSNALYGSSQFGSGPYERPTSHEWRAKSVETLLLMNRMVLASLVIPLERLFLMTNRLETSFRQLIVQGKRGVVTNLAPGR